MKEGGIRRGSFVSPPQRAPTLKWDKPKTIRTRHLFARNKYYQLSFKLYIKSISLH